MKFLLALEDYQKYINKHLKVLNNQSSSRHLMYLNDAIDYSLMSNGKRIRPIMNILFYELFGGHRSEVIDFAMAIELIHTYSLIHDDLPAMDDDVLRRGRATSHIKYNEATAILAGDALLNQSYEMLFSYLEKNFSKNVLRACRYLSRAAGKHGMIVGQVADMELSGMNDSLEDLVFTNHHKTGKLIKASIVTAGLLMNKDEKIINTLESYANNLGMAFQLKDDLLEHEVSEDTLGKSINSDLKNNKKTYIRYMGIERTKKELDVLYDKSIKLLKDININDEMILKMTEFIFDRKY